MDEGSIGVVAMLGNTYTGEMDDVAAISGVLGEAAAGRGGGS